MPYSVYILSNNTNTTIYIGVTNDLVRRVWEHKNVAVPKSFTAKYNVHKLVYFETVESIKDAIAREKQLKGWNRARKEKLINSINPEWADLYQSITE